ncbi:MAG: hypothetical protein MPJ22_10360, partial [Pirellulales bacterium]|nr:hypothetical protein [Pirellulales bacterium]
MFPNHRQVQYLLSRSVVVLALLGSNVNGLCEETDSGFSGQSKLPACVATDYTVVWRDEFEGKVLKTENWTMPSYKIREAASLN